MSGLWNQLLPKSFITLALQAVCFLTAVIWRLTYLLAVFLQLELNELDGDYASVSEKQLSVWFSGNSFSTLLNKKCNLEAREIDSQ